MNWTRDSKILVQGISEPIGLSYSQRMKEYSNNIVAGISPSQGGSTINDIPIFDLVEQAIAEFGEISTSLIFSQSYDVLDAVLEAIAANIKNIIILSSAIPPLDLVHLFTKAMATDTLILGPGRAGILIPDKVWLGIQEPEFYTVGKVGIISYSNRLSDELALGLKQAGLGVSMTVCLGNAPLIASNFAEWLSRLEADEATEVIVILGDVTRNLDTETLESVINSSKKPIIAYIAGMSAPVMPPFRDLASLVTTQLFSSIPSMEEVRLDLSPFMESKVIVAKSLSQIPELVRE